MKNLYLFLFLLCVFTLTACHKDDNDSEPTTAENISKSYSGNIPVFTATDNNIYTEALKNLYHAPFEENYPSLQELPLLGQINDEITVDDIMDRFIVSDNWMIPNFRYVIESMPSSFLQLFKPVTAIVMTRDLKPSFYWSKTAAIYLDPNNFYITKEDRDMIPKKVDYRQDYGKNLKFMIPYTYYNNGKFLFQYERNKEDMRNIAFRLLAHELAHANDYISISNITNVPENGNLSEYEHSLLSDKMKINFPLQSKTLKDAAQVRYKGKTITQKLKKLSPSDIVTEFKDDFANNDYNYTTAREDFAMIFEEFVMKYYLNFDKGIAITDTTYNCTVAWGQMGRIREDHLSEKINYIVSSLIPELDVKNALINFGDPIQFTKDLPWRENINRIFINQYMSSKYKTKRKATDDMLAPTD